MSYHDPNDPSEMPGPPPLGRNTNLVIVVGLLLAAATLVAGVGYWAVRSRMPVAKLPPRIQQLPPRIEETADKKFEEMATAFKDRASGSQEEQAAEIQRCLSAFFLARKQADAKKIAEFFDVRRMFQEINRLDPQRHVTDQDVQEATEKLADTFARTSATIPAYANFHRLEVRRIQSLGESNEVVAYVRAWEESGATSRWRWWAVPSNNSWRFYDSEDLARGLRYSDTFALYWSAADAAGANAHRLHEEVDRMGDVSAMIVQEDWRFARYFLEDADASVLPAPMRAVHYSQWAAVHVAEGSFEQALEYCDRADALHEGVMAVLLSRAVALNGLGRYVEAETTIRRYLDLLGDDAEAYSVLSDALVGLERLNEAADVHRKGLDDDPNSLDNLVGLGLLLPNDKLEEMAKRFRETQRPAETFVLLCNGFVYENNIEAVEALVEAYREIQPSDPEIGYYDAWVKFRREDYVAAAETVYPAIDEIEDEENRQYFIDLYVDSMRAAGKAVQGYRRAPDTDRAFEYVADGLLYDERYDELRKLLEARREDDADDARIEGYAGELATAEEDWDGAIRAFRAAMEKAEGDDQDYYRGSLVYAMFAGGKALQAYREITPTRDVFDQLAYLADDADDAETLEQLIAAHSKNGSTDGALYYWDARASVLRGDHEAAVRTLREHRQAILADESVQFCFDYQLVRSLIHVKQFDDAMREAKRIAEEDGAWFPTLVHAARGDVEATLRGLDELTEEGWVAHEFYNDDILGPTLRSEAFKQVREKYPDPYVEQQPDDSDSTLRESAED